MSAEITKIKLKDLRLKYIKAEQELLNKLSKKDREDVGHSIKEIHMLTKFNANGVEYTVRDSLAIKRFKLFEDLQSEVGYGMDFHNLFSNMNKTYNYLNGGKNADAAVVLHNVMHGIKDHLDDREHPILRLCTLFISAPNEDLSKYDESEAQTKIDNWTKEGISMDSFFQLAFSSVNGFTPALRKVSRNILMNNLKEKQEIQKKN